MRNKTMFIAALLAAMPIDNNMMAINQPGAAEPKSRRKEKDIAALAKTEAKRQRRMAKRASA